MNYAWDQCDNCGKLGLAADLNEDGLCPTCSADDSVVAAKEQELYSFVVCEYCPFPAVYSCDRCGVPVCEQHAADIGHEPVRDVTCMNCAATGDEEEELIDL